jgi:hypothetical protein
MESKSVRCRIARHSSESWNPAFADIKASRPFTYDRKAGFQLSLE